ncbi:MAG: iron ABC transporter substrate-binding protein, partial [Geminicoccales bacterium]
MRVLLLVLLALALARPAAAERLVTDSAGREVAVPDRIERVFPAGPPAMVFLYVLAPDTLLGWTREFRGNEAAYVAEPYRDLPVLGRITGRGGDANLEVVLAARPDLIFDFGSVAPTYVSLADRVQAQTKIPYVLIDGTFENTAPALRLMGGILGVE